MYMGLLNKKPLALLKTKTRLRRARSALQPAFQAGPLRALRARHAFFGVPRFASHENVSTDVAAPTAERLPQGTQRLAEALASVPSKSDSSRLPNERALRMAPSWLVHFGLLTALSLYDAMELKTSYDVAKPDRAERQVEQLALPSHEALDGTCMTHACNR